MLSFAYMYVYGAHEIFLVNARKLNQEVIKDSQCFNLKTKQRQLNLRKYCMKFKKKSYIFHVIQWTFVT